MPSELTAPKSGTFGDTATEAVKDFEANQELSHFARHGISQSAHLPQEVREFLLQKQIDDEVRGTLVLARQHFTIVSEPTFRVVDDPECDEHYVAIDVRADGNTEDVFRQSDAFLDSFVRLIDPSKQRYINLIYHPTLD
jgi:hypothetical protein